MSGGQAFVFAGSNQYSNAIDLGDFAERYGSVGIVGADPGQWSVIGSTDGTNYFTLLQTPLPGAYQIVANGKPVALPRYLKAGRDPIGAEANLMFLWWSEDNATETNPLLNSINIQNANPAVNPINVQNAAAAILMRLLASGELDLGAAVNAFGAGRLADVVLSRATNPVLMLEANAAVGPAVGGQIVWSSPSGGSGAFDNIITWLLSAGAPPSGAFNKSWSLSDASQIYFRIKRSVTAGANGQWDFGNWAGAGGPAAYNFLRSLVTQGLFHARATLNAGQNLIELMDDSAATLFFGVNNAGKVTQQFSDQSGAPGNRTQNTPTGKSAIAAGASQVTITNNQVTANSLIRAWIQQASPDATAITVLASVPAAGSFLVKSLIAAGTVGNATADLVIGWEVLN